MYLFVVWLNSLSILYEASMYVFDYMDEKWGDGQTGPFIQLINSDSDFKMFIWGLTEQATCFILLYIMPILLAVKYRTEENFITMGGTVIGVLTALSYLVGGVTTATFVCLSF